MRTRLSIGCQNLNFILPNEFEDGLSKVKHGLTDTVELTFYLDDQV